VASKKRAQETTSRWAAAPQRLRTALRTGAAVFLTGVVGLLAWGAWWQQPRAEPFQVPDFFAWLFTPEPHRAYREMPLVPAGSRSNFVARGLCSKARVLRRPAGLAGRRRCIQRLHKSRSLCGSRAQDIRNRAAVCACAYGRAVCACITQRGRRIRMATSHAA
jgi:hypothetical protein